MGSRIFIAAALILLQAAAVSEMALARSEGSSSLPKGTSLGEPDSLEMLLFNETNLDFETVGDSTPSGENLSNWSDRQIETFFRDEVEDVNYWLDELQVSEDGASRFAHDVEVAQRSGRPNRTKMSGVSCLAVAIEGEGGGEPAAGKAAIAETILTRAGGDPARICSVIFARAQFEAMTKRARKPSAETLRIAQTTLQKSKGACGFDHFINKSLQLNLGRRMPTWVANFERRGCRHAKIGKQDYYSSCNCRRG